MNWKTLAIIFIIIAGLETAYIGWAFYYTISANNKINECYYEICNDFPDAQLNGDICSCFNYTLMGDLEVAKTEWMK